MNQYKIILFLSILTLAINACTKVEQLDFSNNFVVEAFLFENEAIDNIKIKTTYALEASEDLSVPINEAQVQLIKNEKTYPLVASGTDGFYHYEGNDLTIEVDDVIQLEVSYQGRNATAQTTIPTKPVNVNINIDTVKIPRIGFSPSDIQKLRDALQGLTIEVDWENPNEDWYYIVVENIEAKEDPIFPSQIGTALQRFRFVSDPTQNNMETVIGAGLKSYGTHKVTVYHVNQEYADLFENRTQDSRDLNEPPSNIKNAIGIFTGFASESVLFEVVE
jgi:hypothetical protein